jgi:hypothetical protein
MHFRVRERLSYFVLLHKFKSSKSRQASEAPALVHEGLAAVGPEVLLGDLDWVLWVELVPGA